MGQWSRVLHLSAMESKPGSSILMMILKRGMPVDFWWKFRDYKLTVSTMEHLLVARKRKQYEEKEKDSTQDPPWPAARPTDVARSTRVHESTAVSRTVSQRRVELAGLHHLPPAARTSSGSPGAAGDGGHWSTLRSSSRQLLIIFLLCMCIWDDGRFVYS